MRGDGEGKLRNVVTEFGIEGECWCSSWSEMRGDFLGILPGGRRTSDGSSDFYIPAHADSEH